MTLPVDLLQTVREHIPRRVTVAGVSMIVDHVDQMAAGGLKLLGPGWTRIHAHSDQLGMNDLSIVRADGSTAPRVLVGSQEVRVGDASFDARFLVNADAPARACAWLCREVRAALLRCDRWCVGVENGALEVYRAGMPADEDELEAALRLARSLLLAEEGWRERWRAEAEALDARLIGGPPLLLVCERDAVRVVVEPDVSGRRACVCVHASLLRTGDDRFEIKVRPGDASLDIRSSRPETTARRLTPEVRASLLALAAPLVHCDGRSVGADLDGAEPLREQLERAVRVVATLAGEPGRGPYR